MEHICCQMLFIYLSYLNWLMKTLNVVLGFFFFFCVHQVKPFPQLVKNASLTLA